MKQKWQKHNKMTKTLKKINPYNILKKLFKPVVYINNTAGHCMKIETASLLFTFKHDEKLENNTFEQFFSSTKKSWVMKKFSCSSTESGPSGKQTN